MAILSFKDVGIQGTQRIPENTRFSPIPIGFKTPLELDILGDSIFKMHFEMVDQVDDNFRNLVLTNHGERLALYDFGANLRPLLTEWSNKEDFDSEAMIRINTAVNKYMPYVNLNGYESKPDYHDNVFTGRVRIYVHYSVPALNINSRILETELFII